MWQLACGVVLCLGAVVVKLLSMSKSIEKRIFDALIGAGIPRGLSLMVLAQAKHETNGFTSAVFLKNNNAFGYKAVAGARYQIAAGTMSPEGNRYAAYKSVEDSARDVAGWYKRRQAGSGSASKLFNWFSLFGVDKLSVFAGWLSASGYYGDSYENYLRGLKRWYKEEVK